MKAPSKITGGILILAVILAIAAGAAYQPKIEAQAQTQTQGEGASAALDGSPQPTGNPYLIADIAEQVTPAVVFITTEYPAQPQQQQNPFNDPFFRGFFPFDPRPNTGPEVARGTGFIIDQQGHILTNQHVVGNVGEGQTIKVKISTKNVTKEVEAKLLGSDYQLDLAVLQVKKPDGLDAFPTVKLGDSENSRPGEWVVAIGNPYGEQFEHTVTVGVLSAKGREIKLLDQENRQWKTYKNLMQTDAAINPGNSGGPLVNLKGEVIGINTAVNASAQGIGFAIPIQTALDVKDQLINDGKVTRAPESSGAFLGVQFSDLNAQVSRSLGLPDTKGAIVLDVVPGSAAEKAGLQVYDVIRRVGDQPIENGEDLQKAISDAKVGDEVLLVIWRRGGQTVIPVTLGTRPVNS